MLAMPQRILADQCVSISELRKNPIRSVEEAGGKPLAVLSHNQPAFYCVPTALFEQITDMLEDIELAKIVSDRSDDETVDVDLDDL